MSHEGAAARSLPEPAVEGTEVRNLRSSLRLLRQGKIIGYVDCMMQYRPTFGRVQTPAELAEIRARYTKQAEERYPEMGR